MSDDRKGMTRTDIPEGAVMENGLRNQSSSAGRFWGRSVIYGKEGDANTPYMTRYWIGRLRLHIFYRGDQDPDCHDHPWDFWTFPLTSYVEEVAQRITPFPAPTIETPDGRRFGPIDFVKIRQVVPAWRPTFRPATHCHRVLGRYVPGVTEFGMDGEEHAPSYDSGKIVTLVWRSAPKRKWGFFKNRDGKWCWVAWKEYVFGGGKSAPCE